MKAPHHIAIIPDGNRRWAKQHGFRPWQGHTEGVKRFWEIAEAAPSLGVSCLTFWAASYDNLKKRSALEVKFLMTLLATELTKPGLRELCDKNKARFRVIGEWREFLKDKQAISAMEELEKHTSIYKQRSLTILFGYDGQREMLSAIKHVGSKPTDSALRSALWTGGLPDVDLVIRTGGEPHWSAGFMMWLTSNSQFYFTEKLWPAFTLSNFKAALADFAKRQRRLGA